MGDGGEHFHLVRAQGRPRDLPCRSLRRVRAEDRPGEIVGEPLIEGRRIAGGPAQRELVDDTHASIQ